MAALLEPYQPLYLKHRPQTLGQLVGQRTVVKTLTNAIDNDRLAHAYLFTGPRGCGKTSSARILAKSLNCEQGPTATPCMQCTMCEEIKKGISPAVMEIDAASNNSVDDARVLIERAPLVAQGGRFKLYIIDECHMLTKEAFNALLKTIEEPPPRVIFILATTEEHKVPPTIISRCQRLMFRLANHEELSKHLRHIADIEKIAIEDDALELISRRSGGGLRDALGLLDQASLLATPEKPVGIKDLLVLLGAIEEDVLVSISEGIAERNAEKVLSAVHELLANGREPSLVALELAKHFLNLAKGMHLSKTKATSGTGDQAETSLAQQLITGSQNYIQQVIALSNSFEGSELTQIVMELDRLEQTLRRSTQPSLALEVGLLSLCHRHDLVLFKELAKKVEYLEGAITGGAMPAFNPTHSHSQGHPVAQQQTHTQAPPTQPPVQNSPQSPAPGRAQASPPSTSPSQSPTQTQAAAAPAPTAVPAQRAASVEEQPTSAAPPSPVTQTKEAEAQAAKSHDEPQTQAAVAENTFQPPSRTQAADDFEVNEDGDVEPAISSAEPDQEENEQAAPVQSSPSPQAVSPASEPTAARGQSEDLDEFWSNLMSDLQSRHLPSYSLISQFGFPLSIREDELVIGVLKENFQKMIEGKAEQIKTSAKLICGRELFIKVRVAAQDNPPPAKAVNTGNNSRPRNDGPSGANRGQAQERSSSPDRSAVGHADAEEPGEPALATQSSALRATATVEERRPSPDKYSPSKPVIENSRPSHADLSRSDMLGEGHNGDNQLMVKEAYKLFEGPGSRRVG
jgi:DNA polymerase-3 subunit gamma/tau